LLLYSFIADFGLGLGLFIDVSIFSKIVDKGLGLEVGERLVNNEGRSSYSLRPIKGKSVGYKS